MQTKRKFPILFWVIIVNYLAQIPYYLHQYYFPYHEAPSMLGIILLGFTLVWFFAGYLRYEKRKRFGYGILVSFLATQVIFYLHSTVLGLVAGGGIVAQLQTKSPLLFIVFVIGYVNCIVAAYYLYQLIKHKNDPVV